MNYCHIFYNIRPIWNIFIGADIHKNLLHKQEFLENRRSGSHTTFRTANALRPVLTSSTSIVTLIFFVCMESIIRGLHAMLLSSCGYYKKRHSVAPTFYGRKCNNSLACTLKLYNRIQNPSVKSVFFLTQYILFHHNLLPSFTSNSVITWRKDLM